MEDIEDLKRDVEICVDHITKPFTEEQFVKSFKRFLQEVNFFSPPQYVHLDFNKKKNRILIDDIVYLCADINSKTQKPEFSHNTHSQDTEDLHVSRTKNRPIYLC